MDAIKRMKKSTRSTIITYALVVIAFIVMQSLVSMGAVSSSTQGLLVPITSYICLAISLNLVVGISGELSLGHAGFMSVGAFTGVIVASILQGTVEADPLRFGLAVTDGAGWVRGFVEKPDWPGVVSDLVNTGIYVLSPRAMACVPEGKAFDFARDLFPLLLRRGERIAGLEGYWCDAGTPLSYYRCCADALEGKLKLDIPPEFFPPEGQKKPRRTERAAAVRDFPCRDRAAAMGALSTLMLEMGAEYSDGIRFPLEEGSVHISPRADVSALSVAVDAPDAEFAAALTLSAGEIIKALNL